MASTSAELGLPMKRRAPMPADDDERPATLDGSGDSGAAGAADAGAALPGSAGVSPSSLGAAADSSAASTAASSADAAGPPALASPAAAEMTDADVDARISGALRWPPRPGALSATDAVRATKLLRSVVNDEDVERSQAAGDVVRPALLAALHDAKVQVKRHGARAFCKLGESPAMFWSVLAQPAALFVALRACERDVLAMRDVCSGLEAFKQVRWRLGVPDGVDTSRLTELKARLPGALARALRLHITDLPVVSTAAAALERLVGGCGCNEADQFVIDGCADALLRGLQQHFESAEVAVACTSALWWLMCQADKSFPQYQALLAAGISQAALRAIAHHLDCDEPEEYLLLQACHLLWTSPLDQKRAASLVRAGAVEALTGVLQRHPFLEPSEPEAPGMDDPPMEDVGSHALAALLDLAAAVPDADLIRFAPALEQLVLALQDCLDFSRFITAEDIASLLNRIARSDATHPALVASGAPRMLAGCVREHPLATPMEEKLALTALEALARLAESEAGALCLLHSDATAIRVLRAVKASGEAISWESSHQRLQLINASCCMIVCLAPLVPKIGVPFELRSSLFCHWRSSCPLGMLDSLVADRRRRNIDHVAAHAAAVLAVWELSGAQPEWDDSDDSDDAEPPVRARFDDKAGALAAGLRNAESAGPASQHYAAGVAALASKGPLAAIRLLLGGAVDALLAIMFEGTGPALAGPRTRPANARLHARSCSSAFFLQALLALEVLAETPYVAAGLVARGGITAAVLAASACETGARKFVCAAACRLIGRLACFLPSERAPAVVQTGKNRRASVCTAASVLAALHRHIADAELCVAGCSALARLLLVDASLALAAPARLPGPAIPAVSPASSGSAALSAETPPSAVAAAGIGHLTALSCADGARVVAVAALRQHAADLRVRQAAHLLLHACSASSTPPNWVAFDSGADSKLPSHSDVADSAGSASLGPPAAAAVTALQPFRVGTTSNISALALEPAAAVWSAAADHAQFVRAAALQAAAQGATASIHELTLPGNAESIDWAAVLHIAAARGHSNVVAAVLSYPQLSRYIGDHDDVGRLLPLCIAGGDLRLDTMRVLLDDPQGMAGPMTDGFAALWAAVEHRSEPALAVLRDWFAEAAEIGAVRKHPLVQGDLPLLERLLRRDDADCVATHPGADERTRQVSMSIAQRLLLDLGHREDGVRVSRDSGSDTLAEDDDAAEDDDLYPSSVTWATWAAQKGLAMVLSALLEDPRLDVVQVAGQALRKRDVFDPLALRMLQRQPSVLRELAAGMPARFQVDSSSSEAEAAAAAPQAQAAASSPPSSGSFQRFAISLDARDAAFMALAAWRRRRAAVFAYWAE